MMGRRPRRSRTLGRKGNSRRPHPETDVTGSSAESRRTRDAHHERNGAGVPECGHEEESVPLARTTGPAIDIDAALRGVLTLGWLEADDVRQEPLPESFQRECGEVVGRMRARFENRQVADIPGVSENRSMFHRLGIDPTKTRPSSEALLRRVLKGQDLPSINPIVDVCNLASLEFQLPLGLYDRREIRGPVFARLGRKGEGYDGIRKAHVNLGDRPLLADDDGAFGAPTSDSARTQVTDATKTLLVIVYRPLARPGEDLSSMLARVADLLARYCGATVRLVQTLR
jgi:DNA/RNA-binding domain of Phe-tRNA-synthetase-like protein